MFSNFIKLSQGLSSNSIKIKMKSMNKIIQNYKFLCISKTLDVNQDQQIFRKMEESKAVIVNRSDNSELKEERQFLFIGFKDTILIIKHTSLSFLQDLFSINQKIKICFLSDTEDIFNQNIKIEYHRLSFNQTFQEEISNFNQYLSISPYVERPIHQIWNIVQPCISGFLIKQSYEKLTKNRFQYFNSNNSISEELNEDEYIELRIIGFGAVFKAILLYNFEKEELFCYKTANTFDNETPKLLKRELDNYSIINHPFLPKFYGTINKYPVIEFINGQEINNLKMQLEISDKITIIFELMIVLKYLHDKEFIFRDLKPNNIMIDINKTMVLIDFDRMIRDSKNPNFTADFQTVFMAPEVYSGDSSYKSDIYSLGMIMYYIMSGKMPNNNQELEIDDLPEKFFQIQKMIYNCTLNDVDKRPSIDQLILEYYAYYNSEIQIEHFLQSNEKSFCVTCYDYPIVSIENTLNDESIELLLSAVYYEHIYANQEIEYPVHRDFIFASKNNKYALFNLGVFYFQGKSVPFDVNKAIHYYIQSANQNYSKANLALANVYYESEYVLRDIEKSIYYYQLASEQGEENADFNLAAIYYEGKVVRKDLDKAVYYFSRAADKGDKDALYILGEIFSDCDYKDFNIQKAIHYYILSAEEGHDGAYFKIGNIYCNGKYIKHDIQKAIHFYELASSFNDSRANYKLATIYYDGYYIEQDINKAMHYFSLAAEGNDIKAQNELGLIYYQGKFVPQNINKAIYYFTLASNNNYSRAQYNLGVLYSDGEYVQIDINKAIHYYELAAKQNFPKAYLNIGFIYIKGQYIQRNVNKAIHYFSLASDQDDADAQYNLGLIYCSGRYIQIDIQKGIHYLLLASNKNHLLSQCFLGDLYLSGKKISFDINKAIYYFSLAASQDDPYAQLKLGKI